MASNYLKLNDNKTEIIFFGPNEKEKKTVALSYNLGPLAMYNKPLVKNLGVLLLW